MEKKHYIIIIAMLVVLNIFSWRIWWESPDNHGFGHSEQVERGRGRRGDAGPMKFFADQLKLTPEQILEFDNLKETYFLDVGVVNDSMNVVRKRLMASVGGEIDEETRNTLFSQMAKHKLKIEQLTIQHFNSMRNVCNEEQKPMFDTIMMRMMEHNPMFKEGGRSRGKLRRGPEMERRK